MGVLEEVYGDYAGGLWEFDWCFTRGSQEFYGNKVGIVRKEGGNFTGILRKNACVAPVKVS